MAQRKPIQPSSLGLIVLWLLVARPMHVYGMQKLIETFGKDKVVNVRSRASLYQALDRLVRHGLVEVHETVHSAGYPDRVVYAITDAGRDAAATWLRDMLRTTGAEYPDFIAAVSVLFGLAPDDARAQLQERAERLAAELAETNAVFAENPDLPRLFLLEEEYRRAMLAAELDWVRSVVRDLDAGELAWTEDWLMSLFAQHDPMKHPQEDS
ncbi:MAG TPA: PadR family transcriptional regulator [Gaiellales bacterium]|jgi:DNA-binding PadR family transcriptional regulator